MNLLLKTEATAVVSRVINSQDWWSVVDDIVYNIPRWVFGGRSEDVPSAAKIWAANTFLKLFTH